MSQCQYRSNAEIGELLRELRIASELTTTELSISTDIDEEVLAKIESGERALTAREVLLFSEVFEVRSDYILRLPSSSDSPLVAKDTDSEDVVKAIELFQECIDDYFGIKALVKD